MHVTYMPWCGVTRTGGAIQHLKSDKDLKQEGRGAHDFISDGHVSFIRWNDNSTVTIGSNFMCHEPVGKVKMRMKGGRREAGISVVVSKYNSGMGGIDLLDQLCGSYRPTIYSKKWWWPLFTHTLNVSVVAAWRLYQSLNPKNNTSHLDFRRKISIYLMRSSVGQPKSPANCSGGHHVCLPDTVRLNHRHVKSIVLKVTELLCAIKTHKNKVCHL